MQLFFTRFSLESSFACSYDWVAVYDGSSTSAPLLGRFCGSNIPSPMRSSGPSLHVVFSTDSMWTDTGFEARYVLGESELA